MFKKITFSFAFLFGLFSITAQDVDVSVGASYSNQAFYTLSNDETVTLDNEAWDLAFTTGVDGAAILYNESAKISFGDPVPELRLYLAPTDDFSDIIDSAALTDSLYNGEASWVDGAFNSVKNENDPDDYGWGVLNSGTQVIEGTKVYAIKLWDDSWRKIKIESLDNGIYTMKYANLDGSNETTIAIDKGDYMDSPFAFFSFGTGGVVASPANWDLLFARYYSGLEVGGEVTQYLVTGVLSGPGIEIAQANDVNPISVDYEPYLDSMETRLDVIGHDWKYFDLGEFSWVIDLQRAYFLKLPDDHLWKVVFIDFSGSSTGTFTFIKEDLGILNDVENPASNFIDFGVFPNPVTDEFSVSFSLKEHQDELQIQLVNLLGQVVWHKNVDGNAGLNVLNFQAPAVPSGVYQLVVSKGADLRSSTIFVK